MIHSIFKPALEKILEKLLVRERVSPGDKKLDNLISVLFVIGLILLVWVVFIYRRTLIDVKIPLLIWLVPGIFLTPLYYNKFNRIDGRRAHWVLHYIAHTGMTGAFLLFGFMASNFYFAGNQSLNRRFEIVSKGSIPGGKGHRNERQPYVVIDYGGFKKELIFTFPEEEKIDAARYVDLTVKQGLWGFEILERYDTE